MEACVRQDTNLYQTRYVSDGLKYYWVYVIKFAWGKKKKGNSSMETSLAIPPRS